MDEQSTIERVSNHQIDSSLSASKIRGRLRSRFRTLALIATLALAAASAVALAYGLPAGVAVISFCTALGGLTKALIELHIAIEKREGEKARGDIGGWRRRRRPLAPTVVAALAIGIVAGYCFLPWAIDVALSPSAGVKIPTQVAAKQQVQLSWRNIPPDEDTRVLVREKGASVNIIEPCRGSGSHRGSIECDLSIGGRDDSGRVYEIRLVRLPHRISEQLSASSIEGAYVTDLPEQVQVLASTVVVRQ
jgi:hypothetical protein